MGSDSDTLERDIKIVRTGIDEWCVTKSGDEISAAFEHIISALKECGDG